MFKHPFAIAHGIRDGTDSVFVKLVMNDVAGFGEATLPPYVKESQQSVIDFISKISFEDFTDENGLNKHVNFVTPNEGNYAAKAALDIALHDLYGKVNSFSCLSYLEKYKRPTPAESIYTIGFCSHEELKLKLDEASAFTLIKLKLIGTDDESFVALFKRLSNKKFCVDANQAWKDVEVAKFKVDFLQQQGCVFIEQPMPEGMEIQMPALQAIAQIPLIADESFQGDNASMELLHYFDGVNIKLMKCGGLTRAKNIIQEVHELQKKIMIGCMSESSCGTSAAAHLMGAADWLDLDGPLLIKNDPFENIRFANGQISINKGLGLGIAERASANLQWQQIA
ncbi:MAG: dipeptide epimerase [Bacteroidetes bacterium]|nr:dipeptide epimerase [Bacteroidota bacterium]